MEESDAEDDLHRLTNLKPIKKKKHRFGLPVWHIPWPVHLQVSWQKLQSVGFDVAIASPFSYKLTRKQGLPTERKGLEDFQKFSCTTDTLTNYARMSCHHLWRHHGWGLRIWPVREDPRKQIEQSFTCGNWWYRLRCSHKGTRVSYIKGVCFITKTGFCSIIPRAEQLWLQAVT